MADFGVFLGKEFFNLKLEKRKFLINKIIRERDSIILVGNEKSGKSLLTFQLICSLTSQHPFLDEYNVLRQCKVSYVQIEGELEDSLDRFNHMIEELDFEEENFQLLYQPPLALDTKEGREDLLLKIQDFKPDILIIDPVYFAFNGDLSDNTAVRKFIGSLRIIKTKLQCAILLTHHTHRLRFNFKTGNIINEGDEAMFGSRFFKAWPDHILLLVHNKATDIRTFSCDTQRSGDIIKQSNLKLTENLYFEKTDILPTRELLIINALNRLIVQEGLNAEELMKITSLKKNSFYNSLKKPLKEKIIKKVKGRPVRYILRERTSV